MITIYVLMLPQRVRDSLEQECAEVHIRNVRQYALLSIVQDLDHLRGQKRKTGPLEYREAL
jgi:hypothetical protein